MNDSRNGFKAIDIRDRNLKEIKIGILGYGFMGKMHSTAYTKIPMQTDRAPAKPVLVAMCGRDEQKVREIALRFGYQGYYTKWEDLVADPEIEVFDNSGPDYMHCEPCLAAAEANKHIVCEKPFAVTVAEARSMVEAVKRAKVKNLCGFNYRFIPAVRLARHLIEKGVLGTLYSFNGKYLQEWGHNPQTPIEDVWYARGKGTGVMFGIGSHLLDAARYLIGEVATVTGKVKTFNNKRPNAKGTLKDAPADELNAGIVEFENGCVGLLEASAISTGRKNFLSWEVTGSRGSLSFNLEDLNHLQVYLDRGALEEVNGFSNVSVTASLHPYYNMAWAPGHNIGWENAIIYELFHFIDAVANDKPIGPDAATFEDGYKVQYLMELIKQSSLEGRRLEVDYTL